MTATAQDMPLDADSYLAWEEQQPDKHEYVRGEVFAMVGARREHVVVTLNLAAALKQRLRGGPCQAYVSDLKLRVAAADAFFYPDVMVSFDRGEKFAAYRSLASLQEYVLVDIPARRVESFRRVPDDEWLLHVDAAAGDMCRFRSLDVAIPLAEVFENLAPDAA
jgi:Uma2 family endonuclease